MKMPCPAEEIDDFLARPTAGAVKAVQENPGDILVAGAGGKMGVTMSLMTALALKESGSSRRVIAVSRFSDPVVLNRLKAAGVETISADLLDQTAVDALPKAANVIFMAGQKFGTSASPDSTWAMNTLAPARMMEKYRDSKFVVFSTGCVYPFAWIAKGGSRERDATRQVGDYPNSAIGREQIVTHFSKQNGTCATLFRLNYAIDFRYGILLDIAQKVLAGEPVDVTMGHVNVIWQGDACARALQSLGLATSPPCAINVTGPETVSVRFLAARFGEIFGKEPLLTGQEAETAWLSDAGESFRLWGYPSVTLAQMIEWVAAWLMAGGDTFGKPTHFEVRDGRF